jgi:hypothetical protein
MTHPASLKELAARVVANRPDLSTLIIPNELRDYIRALQGVSLDMADSLADEFEKLMQKFMDLSDDESTNPHMIAIFINEFEDLEVGVQATLRALATDLSIILSEGSQEWQAYAVPLLTAAQSATTALGQTISNHRAELQSLLNG